MLLKDTLLDAVSEIIGSKDILLHHTKAHVKPPGNGSPFPMHQVSSYVLLWSWSSYPESVAAS